MKKMWKMIMMFIVCGIIGMLGHGKEVSAKAEIRSMSKEGKLTIASVKHAATELYSYPLPGIYGQVVDGHYYYMRQTGNNRRYTVYRDKGKKVGAFKETNQGPGYAWNTFGWHEGKLYVEFIEEDDHKIKIGVINFKQESIKTICTCTLPVTFDLINTRVYLYQDKIYAMDENKMKVKEFDKWYDDGFYEYANVDYAPALYYMDFNGGNVKKIAKYNKGHWNYDGGW